ncbi:MAG: hypothetical protein K8R53_00530, partial [Bacteroidales bacterium]|nr:hypothetical protein [Bacteroidales bacterium]
RWFIDKYCSIKDLSVLNILEISPSDPLIIKKLKEIIDSDSEASEVVTIAVCYESSDNSNRILCANDNLNMVLSNQIANKVEMRWGQVLTFIGSNRGLNTLISDRSTKACPVIPVKSFGMIESIINWEVLLHEEQDKLALEIHENYYISQEQAYKQSGRRFPDPQKPAHKPWDELEEIYKESNRQFADHMPVKLRSIGCFIDDIRKNQPNITDLNSGELEILSKMEHNRWVAERKLACWKTGKRDDANKIHPDLVDWVDLPPEERNIDSEMVKTISLCLQNTGRAIYR